jgi:hypothetical protein
MVIIASVFVPVMMIIGCITWIAIVGMPTFGNVIALVASLVLFMLGSCEARSMYAKIKRIKQGES